MIEIKAKNKGESVEMSIEVTGKGSDIVEEFAAIMIELPKQLSDVDPRLFRAATSEFKAQVENYATEILERNVEVRDGTKQN